MNDTLHSFRSGRSYALMLALAVGTICSAQRNCGSMPYLEQQIQADPGRGARLAQIEAFTAQYIQDHGQEDRAVVTIPVVFHIVWATTAQNISDAKVLAQIAQLNADLARLNSDAGSTPSVFASLASNTEIQFCLAQRDPNGNATTGIVRRNTTASSFTDNDNVKRFANGGSDPWPRASYLNLWSCNLGGGVLGYAQFPGGPAATDGVVVLFSSVGSIASPGTATPYNLGRTATHEVGHWLNLVHIWGDATCGNDLVSDTPTQQTANGGCPNFPKVSCSNGPNGEMFMNYMDYTDDRCMNMFSNGQKSRMQALFGTGGSRVSLLTSLGCTPPSGTSCATPSGLAATGITTTSASLGWSAVPGASSYNVQYKTAAASVFTTVSIATTNLPLAGLIAGTAYNAQVQAVCAGGNSAYSAAITFNTTSAGGCTDVWESNNTSGTSRVIGVNTDIQARIGSNGDNDWYRFNNTSAASRIRINLSNLAGDYDVRLYRGTSTQVGISQNGGTSAEQIILNTTNVNTYYVRVYGYNGAFSATACYTLRASTSGTNFREGAVEEEIVLEPAKGLMNLYPNPANDKVMLDYVGTTEGHVDIILLDAMGRQVLTTRQGMIEGPTTLSLPLPVLSNGLYFLNVIDGSQCYQQRFLIQR